MCIYSVKLTRFATLLEKFSKKNSTKKTGRNSPGPIIQCLVVLVLNFCYFCETCFGEILLVLKTCLLGVECSFRTKTRQFLPNVKSEKKNEKKKKNLDHHVA
jgi:hypothetical protein